MKVGCSECAHRKAHVTQVIFCQRQKFALFNKLFEWSAISIHLKQEGEVRDGGIVTMATGSPSDNVPR